MEKDTKKGFFESLKKEVNSYSEEKKRRLIIIGMMILFLLIVMRFATVYFDPIFDFSKSKNTEPPALVPEKFEVKKPQSYDEMLDELDKLKKEVQQSKENLQ